MSASKTDSHSYVPAMPTDLRWVDPKRPTVPESPTRIVLDLVERVCGPDSDIAQMLGIDGVSA